MKMRKVVMAALVAGSVASSSIFADEADRINKLIIQMKVMQDEIKSLRKNLKSNEVAVKEVKESGKSNIKLGKLVEELKVKGDLRLRYELHNQDDETDPSEQRRDRYRYRLRLGGEWKLENDFIIGTRFAIGGGTSTNETMSNQANPLLGVDRVYVQYRGFEDFKLTAGRMPNPFEKNELIWDGDLNPEGASVQYNAGSLFVNAAAIVVDNDGWNDDTEGDNSNLFGIQAGIKTKGDVAFTAGIGYFKPNEQTQEKEIVNNEGYKITMGEGFADISIKTGDKSKVNLFAKVVKNLTATSELAHRQIAYADANETASNNDLAWEAGVGYKRDKLSLKYTYRHVEGDAVWNAINDGDFGDNRTGHILGVKYKIAKNWSIGGKYFNKKEIEETTSGKNKQEEVFQFDLAWKF